MPYLIHKDRDGSVIQFWNLHEGPLTVGRGTDANARVDDNTLSQKHFTVTFEPAGPTIKDLQSKNGTRVNGKGVTEQVLKPNDAIQAGQSTFLFMEGLSTLAMKIDKDLENLAKSAPGSP